ncbi:hypothetical protein BASA81_012422 [Batrachochytrium salamandrivorans]|nr:hypothetical protein BASA81_012422 [Batrachochytrium salamandrivorans]
MSSTRNQEWLEKGLGKKMLMKLGWKEGEGLGAEGKGRTVNVAVEKNMEQTGLGFKRTAEEDAGSVKQIATFNTILTSLTAEYEQETKSREKQQRKKLKVKEPSSSSEEEEEEVRPARGRRRPRKFLDAKTTSNYSKEAMKAILGGLDV